jgi:hypothetical protein
MRWNITIAARPAVTDRPTLPTVVPGDKTPRAVFRQAEKTMMRRRAGPPDMRGAVASALTRALCGAVPPPRVIAAGQAIAGAVADHAASFPPLTEPQYHDQHHQAEATIAMGWLCATACRLGLLAPQAAAAGVLAMAGHDLQHDGSMPPAGTLEARSASLAAALAARAGLDAAMLDTIRRVILATDPARPQARRDADDLLCRIGREADLFASLTPELGWRLSRDLASEAMAAQFQPDPPHDSFAGRLRLLCAHRQASPPGWHWGLGDAVADQIAALAACGDGDAATGAAWLDAQPPDQARTHYLAALAAVTPA